MQGLIEELHVTVDEDGKRHWRKRSGCVYVQRGIWAMGL